MARTKIAIPRRELVKEAGPGARVRFPKPGEPDPPPYLDWWNEARAWAEQATPLVEDLDELLDQFGRAVEAGGAIEVSKQRDRLASFARMLLTMADYLATPPGKWPGRPPADGWRFRPEDLD